MIYTAHWDHLGVGLPDAKGDRIYNGAVDNASGISALIELARAFAQRPRARAHRGVPGGDGRRERPAGLANTTPPTPLYPLAKTVGDDQHGRLQPYGPARRFHDLRQRQAGPAGRPDRAKAKTWPLLHARRRSRKRGHFFRSDHFSFAKRGVPAISFGSGQDLGEGGAAAGKAARDATRPTTTTSRPTNGTPNWTFDRHGARPGILYAVGRELANSRAWPNWTRDSEFRAARDSSASERK